MKPRVLLIRADASVAVGTGHMMRCLALAQAWRDAAGDAKFVVGEMPEALAERFVAECGALVPISRKPGSMEDAAELVAHARRIQAEWVVVDGDRFDSTFLGAVQSAGIRVLLIDDFANRESFPVDLVVNPNSKVDEGAYLRRGFAGTLLAGEPFVLLRREFRLSPSRAIAVLQRGARVLVTLGGSDPENLAPSIAKALHASSEFQVTVVAGPGYNNIRDLKSQESDTLLVMQNPSRMEELMHNSDFAVIAAGGTLWELLAVGCVVLSYSRNPVQARVVKDLASRGIIVDMGETRNFNPEELRSAIRQLVSSPDQCRRMAELGRALVDGLGSTRVVAEMLRSGARN
jgi:UDP-2,4-diacetamido-2,4,6-trideoxy-beta-L-altropyranose hydrolase